MSDVRAAARAVEALHAVVYFAPEAHAAYQELGLRGFWRGYFASRLAALGPVGPDVGVAVLGGFAPAMVGRALPAVWDVAGPSAVLAARRRAAGAALRRLGVDGGDLLRAAAEAAPPPGRPLAAAQRAQPRPRDPVEALWHDATVLREHRGDGHLAAVAVAGLSWPEPHLLLAGLGRLDPQQRDHRGYDPQQWDAARQALVRRGLLDVAGRATPAGAAAYEQIEARTDALSHYDGVDLAELGRRGALAAVGLPFPNAIGLLPLR